jgi:hypothetical protein
MFLYYLIEKIPIGIRKVGPGGTVLDSFSRLAKLDVLCLLEKNEKSAQSGYIGA